MQSNVSFYYGNTTVFCTLTGKKYYKYLSSQLINYLSSQLINIINIINQLLV